LIFIRFNQFEIDYFFVAGKSEIFFYYPHQFPERFGLASPPVLFLAGIRIFCPCKYFFFEF